MHCRYVVYNAGDGSINRRDLSVALDEEHQSAHAGPASRGVAVQAGLPRPRSAAQLSKPPGGAEAMPSVAEAPEATDGAGGAGVTESVTAGDSPASYAMKQERTMSAFEEADAQPWGASAHEAEASGGVRPEWRLEVDNTTAMIARSAATSSCMAANASLLQGHHTVFSNFEQDKQKNQNWLCHCLHYGVQCKHSLHRQ